MKSNKKFRKDDLSPENNTKKIYKMYKRKKQWVVAPVLIGLLLNAVSPVVAFAVTDTEEATAETAQLRAVDEELQKLINQAVTSINELVSLDSTEKTTYLQKVTTATTKLAIESALLDAYKADVAQQVINVENEYASKIDGLSSLDQAARDDYKLSITNALGLTGLKSTFNSLSDSTKYGEFKKAFETDLSTNKAAADEIVVTAQTENDALTDLPKYKEQQKKLVEGMTHFSAIEKDKYIAQITNAANKSGVETAINNANNAYQSVLTALVDEKVTELTNKLSGSSLLPELITSFNRRINTITEKATKEDNDLVELATITSEIDKAIADKESTDLNSKKVDVKSQITSDAGTIVKATDVKRFHNMVDAATTSEAVDAVKKEWDRFLAVETIKQNDLVAAKSAANDALVNLEFEEETTLANYKAYISVATSPEAVAGILAEAQATRKKEIAAVVTAKEAAVKEVQAFSNLTPAVKETHIGLINAAGTSKAVKIALDNAKAADEVAKLANAKTEALSKIATLTALTITESNGYKTSINASTADTLEKIDKIVSEAMQQNNMNKINAAELSDAKEIAKEAIKNLTDLTATQANNALKSITAAKTVPDVAKALKAASELNAMNKKEKNDAAELAEVKDKAKKEIDAMEYLSAVAKEGYKAEVTAKTTIDDVTTVVNDASTANLEIKSKQDIIQAAKTAAVNVINNSPELTAVEKQEFANQVFKCSTKAEVEIIESKVKQLITDRQIAAATTLVEAKDLIENAINELVNEGLDGSQATAYIGKVNNATTKEEATAIYEEAKAEMIKISDIKTVNKIDSLIASGSYVQAQEKINELKSDSTRKQYQTKLNNSIALSEAKAEANKQIDALENFTAEEKKAAKEKISKLTTKAAVEKEVKALVQADNLVHDKTLIELAEAQIKSKDFDKAAKTIEKIRDADTKAKLQKQLEDAQKVAPTIKGTGHVSKIGWQKTVAMNEIIGTTGRKLALEAVKLNLADVDMPESAKKIEGGIQYRAHVRNIGWQGYKANSALAGTTGKSLQMEAIQIRLTGELAKRYDVQYRAHSKDKGWSSYVSNGATAGTTGKSLRMEALQIRLVEKK